MRYAAILLLLIVVGCSGNRPPAAEYMTMEGLALALRLNNRDFAIDPVEKYFTAQELDWFINQQK